MSPQTREKCTPQRELNSPTSPERPSLRWSFIVPLCTRLKLTPLIRKTMPSTSGVGNTCKNGAGATIRQELVRCISLLAQPQQSLHKRWHCDHCKSKCNALHHQRGCCELSWAWSAVPVSPNPSAAEESLPSNSLARISSGAPWTQTEQGHPRATPLSSHDCEHRPAVVAESTCLTPYISSSCCSADSLGMLDDTQLYAGHVHLPRKFRLLAVPPETCNWALANQRC